MGLTKVKDTVLSIDIGMASALYLYCFWYVKAVCKSTFYAD